MAKAKKAKNHPAQIVQPATAPENAPAAAPDAAADAPAEEAAPPAEEVAPPAEEAAPPADDAPDAPAEEVAPPADAPAGGSYNTRVCVPAPMPIACPHCGGTRTTAANGVHYNLHYWTRYEHRVCPACGFTFTAARRMTREEIEQKTATRG